MIQNSPAYDPPEPSEAPWCDDCGNYGCQCDRDYAAYLVAWSEAVESGELDADVSTNVEMSPIGDMLPVGNTELEAA
jgi:hypothetical protein